LCLIYAITLVNMDRFEYFLHVACNYHYLTWKYLKQGFWGDFFFYKYIKLKVWGGYVAHLCARRFFYSIYMFVSLNLHAIGTVVHTYTDADLPLDRDKVFGQIYKKNLHY
jgi:hypothetical protein